ncbi:MAG TPA: ABC transporter permease [Gemmatimonadaceae bacterium]
MGSYAHRDDGDNGWTWLDHLSRDARHALRLLRKSPGFSALAILTLAIGVGATTAIFSVVDATLLRPLPYREPDRLMSLFLRMPVQNDAAREIDMVWSYPKYMALVRGQRVFSELSPRFSDAYPVGSPDGADLVRGESVGADYFDVLGVSPERGRFFSREEDRPTGGDRVVVLSDAFWHERFGASMSAIGGTLDVGGQPFTIIGVAPPGFAGMSGSARIWPLLTAMRSADQLRQVDAHNFEVVARLAPGASVAAAREAMVDLGRTIDATYPNDVGHWRAAGYTLDELRVDPLVGKSVLILAGAVALLLLIACVNVASLLLARGAARRRELAVRMAIGASRRRLISQMLTESAVLAGAGVLIGLVLALLSVRALASMAPLTAANLSSSRGSLTALALGGIALDWRSVLFSTIVALGAGIAAGLAPALSAAKMSLADAMRQNATTDAAFTGLRRITTRGVLIVAEIALAVILLVGSGLMIRSLSQLFDTPLGYQPDHLLTARVTLNAARVRTEPTGQLWDELTRRVGAMPGVVSAAITSCAPVGDHCDGTDISVPGHIGHAHVSYIVVSPNYFATIGAPLLRGRDVAVTDSPNDHSVLLINNTAARTIWGNDNPLTTPIPGDHPIDIVGVVGDVRFEDLESPAKPTIFAPISQSGRRTSLLVVHTAGDPAALASALRRELREIDRNHVITEVKTMRERLLESAARSRFASRVLSTFAVVALALAGLGIYGVISLAVTQRRREFSVRIALGATQSQILGMVVSEAFSLVAAGALLGIGGAFLAARAMTSLLYGVTAADATTYVASAAVLAAAALVAALIPAIRAMRVQPAAVLRGD